MKLFQNKCYINGNWCDSSNSFPVYNPYNDQLISNVPNLSIDQIKQAIDDAHAAFSTWKLYNSHKKSEILYTLYSLIEASKFELAKIISLETGKPIKESIAEVEYGNSYVKWFAEEIKRAYGDIIPSNNNFQKLLVTKEPIGVVGLITPWNFPFALVIRKAAAALAAGCTIIIKPSELTPFSSFAIAELTKQLNIPSGVINIITGDNKLIGKEFCINEKIKKISFTGSTQVGKILMEQSAHNLKKLSLELGGNAAFIVFNDANLDKAIEGLKIAKFRNTGQTCIAANRVFVAEDIYDIFLDKLKNLVTNLKIGDPMNMDTEIGAIITKSNADKINLLLTDAKMKGATIEYGGFLNKDNKNIIMPTIISNISDDSIISQQEIFGPVIALYKFKNDEDVVAIANATKYGLVNYFYSENLSKIWKISSQLESGMIGINTTSISNATCPFGGIKESGFGREGSKYGLDEYLNLKYICLGI